MTVTQMTARSFWKMVLAKPAQPIRDQTALEETVSVAAVTILMTGETGGEIAIAHNSASTDNALHALPDWSPVLTDSDARLQKLANSQLKLETDAENAKTAQLELHQISSKLHV
jgi:hypothetical protein